MTNPAVMHLPTYLSNFYLYELLARSVYVILIESLMDFCDDHSSYSFIGTVSNKEILFLDVSVGSPIDVPR